MDLRMDNSKYMFLKKIVLRAQNMLTISGSIVNVIGEDLYDHLMSTRIFSLIFLKDIHMRHGY